MTKPTLRAEKPNKQIQTVVIGNEPDNKNGLFESHKPDIKAKEIFESIKQTKVRLPEEIRNYIADKVMPQNDDANAQLVGLIENYLAQAQQEAVKRERERIKGIIECMGGFPRKGNLRKVLLANIEREWFGDMAKYNPEALQGESQSPQQQQEPSL